MNIKPILLATDLSEEALRAFPSVEALAQTCGARISLVHSLSGTMSLPVLCFPKPE
ncbi:MAG: universal stress protein [Planctomycetota bacterium]|nr:universal stress protein [Planctomycetota bacterium]MDA1113577.1 universal stress protein [Planctomycetota bacterium]